MEIGLSGQAFGHLLLLGCGLGVLFGCGTLLLAKKRGVNIQDNKVIFTTSFSCGTLFIVLPFWFTNLTIKWKIIGTIAMILVPLANVLFIDRFARTLGNQVEKNKK